MGDFVKFGLFWTFELNTWFDRVFHELSEYQKIIELDKQNSCYRSLLKNVHHSQEAKLSQEQLADQVVKTSEEKHKLQQEMESFQKVGGAMGGVSFTCSRLLETHNGVTRNLSKCFVVVFRMIKKIS